MPVLTIAGRKVTVDDSFLKLSPEEQNETVDEIAESIGISGERDDSSAGQRAETEGAKTEEVGREGESAAAKPTATADADDEPVFSGSILPFSKDAEGNVSFDSDAGLLGVAKRTLLLPSEVMEGKVDPLSDEGIGRAVEFAGAVGPASVASRAGAAASATKLPEIIKSPAAGSGAAVAEAGQRLGVELPRAVTSDRQSIQQAGKIVANVPVGGTPIRKASENAIQQLDDAAKRTQEGFGTGSPAVAGDAVRGDLKTYITETIGKQISDRYNAVDGLVDPAATGPLLSTRNIANDITRRRSEAAITVASPAVKLVAEAIGRPDGLNYQGVKTLRTYVGELLENPSALPSDMSGAELKQIYRGLTTDLQSIVRKGGGEEGARAFAEANTFAAMASTEREALNRFLGAKNDEGLFDRIVATAGSTSRADLKQLANARNAVSDETWGEVASAVVARLGRGPDGAFSPERFITGYGKLSQEGKTALFQTSGKESLAQSLDDIAAVSGRFKQLQKFANPSGTGQTVMGGALGTGLYADPITALSTVAGARVLSTLLAKPNTARQVALWTKAIEMKANKSNATSTKLLQTRTSVLAATIAQEMGTPNAATSIASGLDSASSGTAPAAEMPAETPADASQSAPAPADRERADSPRLTPEDRASPIPSDLIDDGKAVMDGRPPAPPASEPAERGARVTPKEASETWAAFPAGSGTRSVPRSEMPQIKSEHRGALTNFVTARGIKHSEETVPADSLKATQAEFSPERVATARARTGGNRAVLVSSDWQVLDGHHQWLAAKEAGEDIRVLRFDAPIAELLDVVKEFPSATQEAAADKPKSKLAQLEEKAKERRAARAAA